MPAAEYFHYPQEPDPRGHGRLSSPWPTRTTSSSSRGRAARRRSTCGRTTIVNMGMAKRADAPVLLVRRHRPGGRVRLPLRHGGAAGARRAGADQGPCHQQVPGRRGDPPPRPGAAGGPRRQAGAGRGAHAGRGRGRRGLPLSAAGAAAKGGPGRHRGDPPAPPVQLHRLQPPGAPGGGHPPVRVLPPGAGQSGSDYAPRHQEHHGRPALAAPERAGERHPQARRRRRVRGGHLRRLPDAGPAASPTPTGWRGAAAWPAWACCPPRRCSRAKRPAPGSPASSDAPGGDFAAMAERAL